MNTNDTKDPFDGYKSLSKKKFENLIEGLIKCPIHKEKTIYDIDEIGVFCKSCHSIKGTKYPEDDLRKVKFKW